MFGKPVYNSYLFLEDFKFALTAADIIPADQAKKNFHFLLKDSKLNKYQSNDVLSLLSMVLVDLQKYDLIICLPWTMR